MAEPTPEGYESPRERRERREAMAATMGTEEPNVVAPKYDLEEIDRRRNWVGEQIWRAVASGQLNLNNRDQLSRFLGSLRPAWFGGEHGLKDVKEQGRHMRKLFLGDLGEEGWGMGDSGYSRALDEYRPNWSRMVSGLKKDPKTGLYGSGGGKWYDAFGRLVRTDAPAAPVAPPVANTPPSIAPPSNTATSPPPPNPTFYGGTTAPNPYGTTPTASTGIAGPRRPISAGARPQQSPAWYSTWRF